MSYGIKVHNNETLTIRLSSESLSRLNELSALLGCSRGRAIQLLLWNCVRFSYDKSEQNQNFRHYFYKFYFDRTKVHITYPQKNGIELFCKLYDSDLNDKLQVSDEERKLLYDKLIKFYDVNSVCFQKDDLISNSFDSQEVRRSVLYRNFDKLFTNYKIFKGSISKHLKK